jgi:hypothetical protein
VSSGCAARVEPDLDDRTPAGAALDQRVKLAKLFEMVVDFDPPGADWQATQIMRRLARLKLR